jgi:uncharacterized protein (DUF1330 family)
MGTIVPSPEQLQQLATSPDTGPVVMLNLLKLKSRADGGEESGADAYRRYGDAVVKMVEARGGRIVWSGRADQIVIGNPAEDWDAVALVWYPSRKAFLEMVSSPEYQAVHIHRERGLERTILVACTPAGDRLIPTAETR